MRPEDLAALSALCLRSKAHWGYDDAFLAACREEFTFTGADLQDTSIGVIRDDGGPIGVVQVAVCGLDADIDKLFIAPEAIGFGHGATLFQWAAHTARVQGATRLMIESDPYAQPFYERMGARLVGTAPSGSIPGRSLPRLTFDLTQHS